MAQVRYFGTLLIKKLSIKSETKILVIDAPENYSWFDENISGKYIAKKMKYLILFLFTKTTAVFKKEMNPVLSICKKNSSLVIWLIMV